MYPTVALSSAPSWSASIMDSGILNGVTDAVTSVTFVGGPLADVPAVFASLMTVHDQDTADTRIYNVGKTGFSVFAQEEKSVDGETQHGSEYVGYLVFKDGVIRDSNGDVIGEVGRRDVTQSNENTWFNSPPFLGSYSNPVVIMFPNTNNAPSDPFHIRLKDVTSTSFKYQIEEWDCISNGARVTEEVVYLIVEDGTHTLADGNLLEALTVSANHDDSVATFSPGFDQVPVVLSQSQTARGYQAIVTRMDDAQDDSIRVFLQEEDCRDGTHAYEDVGVIAYG